MAAKLNQALSTLSFALIIFLNFPGMTRPDNPCPYPCYPPPTGSGTVTPTTPITTTTPPSQTVSYPPPAGYNPSPTGYFPYNPPPFAGTFSASPPPPDPILPYFPYYYKKPLHSTDSSATTLGRSTAMIATANLLVFLCSFFFL
ncbi:proline-rich receptor-like protein kinase PERK8 [Alnus glutinosa]|uniref:proline-rich receptor-like protein kinase PERK8 n=1 Tax=Alnus glutinosa TaxID=3517 RepID=UPI002D764E53|nr:proline-rich receptor-like protein kinase PERK8 [Alnus glutinosa]